MDLTVMLRAVRRQVWVVASVLVLTAGLALLTMSAFPPTYTVEGEYLLAQGEVPDTGQTGSSEVIAAVVDSRGFGDSPPAPFDDMPYEVTPVEGSSVIRLTTSWARGDLAAEGIDRLIATIEEVVGDLARPGAGSPESQVVLLGRGVRTAAAATPEEDAPAGAFEATASVQIRTPERPQATYGPTDYTATVLTSIMGAPLNVDSYLSIDGIDDFSVATDTRNSAPIVTLSVSGTDSGTVVDTFDAAEDQLQAELAAVQSDEVARGAVPTTATGLARPEGPTLVENNVRRPLAVVVVLGLFIALGAALAVDAYRQQRRERSAPAPMTVTSTPAASGATRAHEREAAYYAARDTADDGPP